MTEQTNEQSSGKFEFEPTKIFLRYKFHLVALVVLILIGILAGGIYSSMKAEKHNGYRDQVYQFEKSTMKDFVDGKVEAEAMITQLESLYAKTDKFEGMIPTLLKSVDQFMKNSDYTSANKLLNAIDNSISNEYMSYMVDSRRAVVFEMLGDVDKAISTYERIVDSSVKLLEKHQYLELGRLYLQKGDKKKAKSSFEFVQKQEPADTYTKMAKVYLEELGDVK